MKIAFLLFLSFALISAQVPDKILICGICRNIESAIPNLLCSVKELSAYFQDYHVIFYENNSTDRTKQLLREWAQENPHVLLISEQISKRHLIYQFSMKVWNRTENLARARNIVLDAAMKPCFDDHKYILWADLDLLDPWPVSALIETIQSPQQEWDGVFAYGAYDLFALRSPRWPIGFELIGSLYWDQLDKIRREFILTPEDPWEKVYSAFGGLGIYKRDAIRGCRYSGVVTKDLDRVVSQWLEQARGKKEVCFLKEYEELLLKKTPVLFATKFLLHRERYPKEIGILFPGGQNVWFSCTPNTAFPWTCEHIPLHVSMIARGHDKLFINPKIRSRHP